VQIGKYIGITEKKKENITGLQRVMTVISPTLEADIRGSWFKTILTKSS
jgi:hypothetical protein